MADPKPITEADLTAAIEAARKEEKDKLYADLKTRQEKEVELRAQAEAAQKKLADGTTELQTLRDQLDTIRKSTASGQVDVEKLVAEVAAKATKASAKKFEEMEARHLALEKDNLQLRLDRFKEKAVKEAGGEEAIISALVGGNSEDEIRQSVQRARQAYVDTETRIKEQLAAKAGAGGNGTVLPSLPNGAGNAGNGDGSAAAKLAGVRQMSPADYAKNRTKFLEQAAMSVRSYQSGNPVLQ